MMTAKGYLASHFTDAFSRYLTFVNVTPSQACNDSTSGVTDLLPVTDVNVTRNNTVT
jgi:hypothetical protein